MLPGWRVVEEGEEDSGRSASISGCTSLEFLERHRGHERKERRMKRDDDDKQRRLQQHREAAVTPPSSPRLPATLVPAAEGLRYLQVGGGAERPIIFGQIMPEMEREWFSMPWDPNTSLKEVFAMGREERRVALGIEEGDDEEQEEQEVEEQERELDEELEVYELSDIPVAEEVVKKVIVKRKAATKAVRVMKSTTTKAVVVKITTTKAVVKKSASIKAVVMKSTSIKAVMKKSTTTKAAVKKGVSTKDVVAKSASTKRGLQTCGTCGHRVAAAGLLQHLCIHHMAELEAVYSPAVLANQCGLCTFVSRSGTLAQRKAVMVKHIGAVHRKVLDYTRE